MIAQKYSAVTIEELYDLGELREIMQKRIAQNIRSIRTGKGLTQERVGELAEISPKFLGEIERGIKNPSAVVLHRLSKALAEPVCVLLSKDCCPYKDDGLPQKLARLMTGKPEQDVEKAVRILEIFFE